MGDPKGFLKEQRKSAEYRPVCERVKDYEDVTVIKEHKESEQQASRCMDCGVPFCHWSCPAGNYIPEWNDLVYNKRWQEAWELLDASNNLPEITGRVCPALCEYGCVLGINDDPVTIRENELAIVEYAFEKGLVKPRLVKKRSDKKIAVIGSGPAGLSCAIQLNRAGHNVVIYERAEKPGGILRYGIPDFKLEKWVIDRRVDLMKKEGIEFIASCEVGKDYSKEDLLEEYDAVCLTGGSRQPRDLDIKGREFDGIYFAMDYLMQSNRNVSGEKIKLEQEVSAKGRHVVVIGGGDTGSDCVGTAHRQGAECVVQIEVMPKPEECRTESQPWPEFPLILKTTSSHAEGGERQWSVLTKEFVGTKGKLKKIKCCRVEFKKSPQNTYPIMTEVPGSEFEILADMVILAIGFVHPEHKGLLSELNVDFDGRGNVKTDDKYMTSIANIFSAGDMNCGQSLVVTAISEGRKAAYHIDAYLMGKSELPSM